MASWVVMIKEAKAMLKGIQSKIKVEKLGL
jgi:hypothetical protein